MNINLFTWIREGVKQAVLHGVNDAVSHIGAASEQDDMPQRILEALRKSEAPTVAAARVEGPSKPRKLGRSLDQIVSADKE